MARSGIVRKLDEVGRIVIPKEIRRYLHLDEGSKLEIGINEMGEVILRSNAEKLNIQYIANYIGDDLAELLKKDIIFVEGDNIIRSVGTDIYGKVSRDILDIMRAKKQYIANMSDEVKLPQISDVCDIYYTSIDVTPIVNDSGSVGCIIAFGDDIKEYESQILSIIAKLCVVDRL